MKKFANGTIFSIPLDGAWLGYGQIVRPHQSRSYYMAGLAERSLAPAIPSCTAVLFLGNFLDILLRIGRWKVVGALPVPDDIPYPCHKIFISGQYYVESWDRQKRRVATPDEPRLLPNDTTFAPMILENAMRWHFGVAPHEDWFDRIQLDYVRSLARFL